MRHKKKKSSYTSEDDDMPLTLVRHSSMNGNCSQDSNHYDTLCVPSREPCELCDRVSKNRFSSLIHNAKHIIIPLLNQTVHQCDICLHHFTSIKDLTTHKSKKHTLSEMVASKNLVNFNNPTSGSYESDLISIVKKENEIKKEHRIKKEDCLKKERILNSMVNSGVQRLPSVGPTDSNDGFSIKSRLLFEEDIISLDNQLLSDLTTDCQVKVEVFPPLWPVEDEEEEIKSVHYDELIKPGVFRCKKCGKAFPRRYDAIIHESSHIYIKDSHVMRCPFCRIYVLGDYMELKHHKLASHPEIYSQDSNDSKNGAKVEENGDDEPYVYKTTRLKLCDVCYTFCKNNEKQNYIIVGDLCDLGKRYRCQKCGYKFFDIKIVKRETRYKYSSYSKKKIKKKKISMSNEARLKIIGQRFKNMKKSYFVVLFIIYKLLLAASLINNSSCAILMCVQSAKQINI